MPSNNANPVLNYIRKVAACEYASDLPDGALLELFADHADEAAFVLLLRRHGAMVRNLCRRILQNEQDADDAFQATFLVLSRKAAGLNRQQSLGGWLHGVAYRVAQKARIDTARRRKHEGRAAVPRVTDPLAEISLREAQAILDQELTRLPHKFRIPLVFCYLEGLTRDEAAHQLGWSPTLLKSRLEQARERLRNRLLARGLALSGALVASLYFEGTASAAVPSTLLELTLKFATADAAGTVVPAQVAALTQGVMKAMLVTKLKLGSAVLLVAAIIGTGAGVRAMTQKAPASGQLDPAGEAKGEKSIGAAAKTLPDKETDKLKRNKKRFEGTWQFASYEVDGQKLTKEEVEEKIVLVKMIRAAQEAGTKLPKANIGSVIVIYDAEGAWKLQTEDGTIVEEGTIEIDPAMNPKTIDTTGTIRGTKQTQTKRGIYEFINEDTFRVCLAWGKERAADFVTKPESGKTLCVMQRVKKEKEVKDALPPANLPGPEAGNRDKVLKLEGPVTSAVWSLDGKLMTVVATRQEKAKDGDKERPFDLFTRYPFTGIRVQLITLR